MIRMITLTAVVVLSTLAVRAQEEGSTEIEKFSDKTGSVVVRGYSAPVSVGGRLGTLTIEAREVYDASEPTVKLKGAVVEVIKGGGSKGTRLFIDASEIDGIKKALDYLAKINSSVTKHPNFEVEFKTKGGFALMVFNDAKGNMSFAIASKKGTTTYAFFELSDIPSIKAAFEKIQGML